MLEMEMGAGGRDGTNTHYLPSSSPQSGGKRMHSCLNIAAFVE